MLQGEDWEYEEDRADDDLDMGIKDEDSDAPQTRKCAHLTRPEDAVLAGNLIF